MIWISKKQPEYVWDGDVWLEEETMKEWNAEIMYCRWECYEERIGFRDKTKYKDGSLWYTMKKGKPELLKTGLNP